VSDNKYWPQCTLYLNIESKWSSLWSIVYKSDSKYQRIINWCTNFLQFTLFPCQSFSDIYDRQRMSRKWVYTKMRKVRWMCDIKVKDRVPSTELRETRNGWYNLGTTAKQDAMVWAYVVKKRRSDEEMYAIRRTALQTKR